MATHVTEFELQQHIRRERRAGRLSAGAARLLRDWLRTWRGAGGR